MNTPGFHFKEGKLFLFDQKSLSVIESWPSLKALRKDGSFGWQEFRPIFPLLSPMGAEPEIDPALLPRESFQMAYQRRLRLPMRFFAVESSQKVADADEDVGVPSEIFSLCLCVSVRGGGLAPDQLLVFGRVSSGFLRDVTTVTPCGEGAADEVRSVSGMRDKKCGSPTRSTAASDFSCSMCATPSPTFLIAAVSPKSPSKNSARTVPGFFSLFRLEQRLPSGFQNQTYLDYFFGIET